MYRSFLLRILFVILISGNFFSACKKTDAVVTTQTSNAAAIINYSISGQSPSVAINDSSIKLLFNSATTDAENFVASFTLSAGASANIGNVPQVSGATVNNFDHNLDYTVTAADHSTARHWIVSATNNNYSYDWGLGHFLKTVKTNDRAYDWYLDQGTTGTYAGVNCGPTSVTMAIKWADESFSKTPEDARSKYESSGGWWYTSDVDSYLTDNQVPHVVVALSSTAAETRDILMKQLDYGRIIILCIDMNYMSVAASDFYHVNKFYPTTPGWGHFFVIKGYQQLDDKTYFQIYDPFSMGVTYSNDNSLKGKNRFYSMEDVFSASNNWWNYALVVSKKGTTIDPATTNNIVDVKQISHTSGQ